MRAALLVVIVFVSSACRVEDDRPNDFSRVEQQLGDICDLRPEQMTFCAFPSTHGFGCFCDRDLCLDLMQQCEPDPRWQQYCMASCPVTVPVPQPPFNPSTDCEERKKHQLPFWDICNFPRCWNLPPGESCIVPASFGGGPES